MTLQESPTVREWAAQIQPEITSCDRCQRGNQEDGIIWIDCNCLELRELLDAYHVPGDLVDDVVEVLVCPGCCGESLRGVHEVGIKTRETRDFESRFAEWESDYAPLLIEFTQWVERFPYLGSHHPIGKQFLEEISEFPKASDTTRSWWRANARRLPSNPTTDEMLPPKEPTASEGRYNHHGQREVFYFASDESTAAAEVLKLEDDEAALAWVLEFQLPSLSEILDLTCRNHPEDLDEGSTPMLAFGLNMHSVHSRPADRSEWKPEYFVPRYIADCARHAGFKGIVFESTQTFGENLVLFELDRIQIEASGKPKRILFKKRQLSDTL
jgi:hypothetical protein